MRALRLNVYRHDYHEDYDPTNGGVSGRCDDILVACDNGPVEVDPANPPENLFRVEEMVIGFDRALHLVPYKAKRSGMVGPMFGGNYASTSDSRWGRMLKEHFGGAFRFNTCLAIHDRYETPEQYRILSN